MAIASPITVAGVTVDAYILDSLMPDLIGHDRQPSAFLVYLCLWRQTHGRVTASPTTAADPSKPTSPSTSTLAPATTQVALRDIAENTGLSKRAVQTAVAWLVKRKLITITREHITAVPVYTVLRPWRR